MSLLECIEEIDRWISSNRLKLNENKTQFIWLGTRQQLAKVDRRPLMVGGVQIAPLDMVRNLGVLLDDELTMAGHVNSVVRGCFFQLRQLRSVQRSLTRNAKKVIVHAFVASKIDYCNSLMYGTTKRVLHPMQVVLNAAARLVVGAGRREHITPMRPILPVQDGCLRFPLYPSVSPDVSLWYVYIHGWRSWTMSPEVRTTRWGCCIANFDEALWASQLPLISPNGLEQFTVWTEGQSNYIVDV